MEECVPLPTYTTSVTHKNLPIRPPLLSFTTSPKNGLRYVLKSKNISTETQSKCNSTVSTFLEVFLITYNVQKYPQFIPSHGLNAQKYGKYVVKHHEVKYR